MAILRAATPQLMEIGLQALARALAAGNKESLKLWAEIMKIDRAPSGKPLIDLRQINTTQTLNAVSSEKEGKISFDQVIRARDEERRKQIAAAQPEVVEVTAEPAEEAEAVVEEPQPEEDDEEFPI